MKIFLYYVNAIPRLEDVVDRKLVCSVLDQKEEEGMLILTIPEDDISGFAKLKPKACYALRYDSEDGNTEYKYYYLNSFEIKPLKKKVELSLYVSIV